jgi:chromosome segregation ATPase
MVRFRASEPLSEMCGGRGTQQSGGERMITTALYVLALQELTVVPFRVIDEINQVWN